MDKRSIRSTETSFAMISSAYLAMWILGVFSIFLMSPFVENHILSLKTSTSIHIFLLYVFSMLLPAAGLLLFMSRIKESSARWYWAGPLLIAIFLITLFRDIGVMDYLYAVSFIKTYDASNILHNDIVVSFIQLFFAFSSILFTLSVPAEKRRKMVIPFGISIFTFFMAAIFSVATVLLKQNYVSFVSSLQSRSFVMYILGIFSMGISLLWVATKYDKNNDRAEDEGTAATEGHIN